VYPFSTQHNFQTLSLPLASFPGLCVPIRCSCTSAWIRNRMVTVKWLGLLLWIRGEGGSRFQLMAQRATILTELSCFFQALQTNVEVPQNRSRPFPPLLSFWIIIHNYSPIRFYIIYAGEKGRLNKLSSINKAFYSRNPTLQITVG
jgi:hypothetical protein